MQDLLTIIEQIRQRIHAFQDKFKKNEMLTRYCLIDPLLRALGWNTEDPDQVEPELVTQQGRPDYTLQHDGKAFILVEAKKLESNLSDARDSGFKYCWQNRVPFYVITDGDIWELHDLREMGGKQIFRVRITKDSIGNIVRHLLALWRPAMPEVSASLPTILEPISHPRFGPQQLGSSLNLQELRSKIKSGQKPPRRIIFPDGSMQPLNSWKDLLIATARFSLPILKQRNQLPLRGRGQGILIGRSADMRSPQKLDNNIFVETHDSAKGCVRRACQILKEVGIDPETIQVEL